MDSLNNNYSAFRHGESQANVEGIIVSDPAVGVNGYGLTEHGRMQVHQSVSEAGVFDADTLIVASDFKRTAETAKIICDVLGVAAVRFDERLRERFFGEWDGKEHANYSKAWKKDAHDPERGFNGAESTISVRNRMWAVVQSLEDQTSGKTIVLVSHGDPLMLLQTAFMGLDPKLHRTLPCYATAEWRLLNG